MGVLIALTWTLYGAYYILLTLKVEEFPPLLLVFGLDLLLDLVVMTGFYSFLTTGEGAVGMSGVGRMCWLWIDSLSSQSNSISSGSGKTF
jgi:hypothetical protein